jgi:hypothetical protein
MNSGPLAGHWRAISGLKIKFPAGLQKEEKLYTNYCPPKILCCIDLYGSYKKRAIGGPLAGEKL